MQLNIILDQETNSYNIQAITDMGEEFFIRQLDDYNFKMQGAKHDFNFSIEELSFSNIEKYFKKDYGLFWFFESRLRDQVNFAKEFFNDLLSKNILSDIVEMNKQEKRLFAREEESLKAYQDALASSKAREAKEEAEVESLMIQLSSNEMLLREKAYQDALA